VVSYIAAYVGYTGLLRSAGVLTRRQLENARTAELIVLKDRIDRELANRVARDLEAQKRRERDDIESRETGSGTYQWQYRECGHKDRCKRCRSGKKHGPYLYRFYYLEGKYRSEYIPLLKVHEHPNAPPHPA
jgi:hypothetical protein